MLDRPPAFIGAHEMVRSSERFLPFTMKPARMEKSDAPRFRQRVGEAGMANVRTEMRAKALAQGAPCHRGIRSSLRRLRGRNAVKMENFVQWIRLALAIQSSDFEPDAPAPDAPVTGRP